MSRLAAVLGSRWMGLRSTAGRKGGALATLDLAGEESGAYLASGLIAITLLLVGFGLLLPVLLAFGYALLLRFCAAAAVYLMLGVLLLSMLGLTVLCYVKAGLLTILTMLTILTSLTVLCYVKAGRPLGGVST